MNLLERTKNLCHIYGIKPARSKGQNFLIREEIYDKIIAAAKIEKGDLILEVGPGLGFLTAKLAKAAKEVITVELDDKLAALLQTGLDAQGVGNVAVVNGNILDFTSIPHPLSPSQEKGEENYKIVANLPYNITSVFLRKFLAETVNRPAMMVLMLQKEVAERIAAKPGKMSLLAVSVQYYADAEIVDYAPRADFWPAPEVDSAIIKILVKKDKLTSRSNPPRASQPAAPVINSSYQGKDKEKIKKTSTDDQERDFFRLVKFGFSAKRKMLKNNLAAGCRLNQAEVEERIMLAGLDAKCRAEDLSVDNWKRLAGIWYNMGRC